MAARKVHVQKFLWAGPARMNGKLNPEEWVKLTPSTTADALEKQLMMLFDVRPPAQLLIYDSIQVDGTTRMVAMPLAGIVDGLQDFYANDCDPAFLQTGDTVYVKATEGAATCSLVTPASAPSGATSKRSNSGGSDSGIGDKKRVHEPWKQLLDEMWPLVIPRYYLSRASCCMHVCTCYRCCNLAARCCAGMESMHCLCRQLSTPNTSAARVSRGSRHTAQRKHLPSTYCPSLQLPSSTSSPQSSPFTRCTIKQSPMS